MYIILIIIILLFLILKESKEKFTIGGQSFCHGYQADIGMGYMSLITKKNHLECDINGLYPCNDYYATLDQEYTDGGYHQCKIIDIPDDALNNINNKRRICGIIYDNKSENNEQQCEKEEDTNIEYCNSEFDPYNSNYVLNGCNSITSRMVVDDDGNEIDCNTYYQPNYYYSGGLNEPMYYKCKNSSDIERQNGEFCEEDKDTQCRSYNIVNDMYKYVESSISNFFSMNTCSALTTSFGLGTYYNRDSVNQFLLTNNIFNKVSELTGYVFTKFVYDPFNPPSQEAKNNMGAFLYDILENGDIQPGMYDLLMRYISNGTEISRLTNLTLDDVRLIKILRILSYIRFVTDNKYLYPALFATLNMILQNI